MARKAGTISVPGAYVGFPDKIPFGAFMNKGLTMKTGQTHMQKYMKPLLDRIEQGEIDPSFVITHRVPLADATNAYKMFRDKKDGYIKVVLQSLPMVQNCGCVPPALPTTTLRRLCFIILLQSRNSGTLPGPSPLNLENAKKLPSENACSGTSAKSINPWPPQLPRNTGCKVKQKKSHHAFRQMEMSNLPTEEDDGLVFIQGTKVADFLQKAKRHRIWEREPGVR